MILTDAAFQMIEQSDTTNPKSKTRHLLTLPGGG
jgi:hypothetical protein